MLSIGISADDEILLCKVNKFACCYHEIEKDGFRFSLGWLYNLKKKIQHSRNAISSKICTVNIRH